MSGIDVPADWSTEQIHTNVWLKWRLTASPAALVALASADQATTVATRSDASSDDLAVAADAEVLRGNWSAALTLYQRMENVDATQPVPLIGRAVAAIHQRRAAVAVEDLRALRAARPGDPVVAHYLTLALVCRASEVRAVSRDERSVITSTAQLTECERIADELADLAVEDPALVQAVAALARQVRTSRAWTWREQGGNVGVLALVVLFSLVGIVAGGVLDDVWLVVGAALLGAGAAFLYVVTHRRPAWELRAQDLASIGTVPGR
jgi:hypothetical protein